MSPGGCFLKLRPVSHISATSTQPLLSEEMAVAAAPAAWLLLLPLLPGCCLKAAAAASPSLPAHADDSQLASEWEALVFRQTHKWHRDEIN